VSADLVANGNQSFLASVSRDDSEGLQRGPAYQGSPVPVAGAEWADAQGPLKMLALGIHFPLRFCSSCFSSSLLPLLSAPAFPARQLQSSVLPGLSTSPASDLCDLLQIYLQVSSALGRGESYEFVKWALSFLLQAWPGLGVGWAG
jgi:hypothetical protein